MAKCTFHLGCIESPVRARRPIFCAIFENIRHPIPKKINNRKLRTKISINIVYILLLKY